MRRRRRAVRVSRLLDFVTWLAPPESRQIDSLTKRWIFRFAVQRGRFHGQGRFLRRFGVVAVVVVLCNVRQGFPYSHQALPEPHGSEEVPPRDFRTRHVHGNEDRMRRRSRRGSFYREITISFFFIECWVLSSVNLDEKLHLSNLNIQENIGLLFLAEPEIVQPYFELMLLSKIDVPMRPQ